MIEFKGAYIDSNTKESKSVLVQFDGVLLQVWHMADPFCRLLTSDVFRLQPSVGKSKRYIKLPDGNRIETDNVNAFLSMHAIQRPLAGMGANKHNPHRMLIYLGLGCAALAATLAVIGRIFHII